MIIKTEVSNKEVLGDVQTQTASIDVQDLDFILHILSSNLYSNPIQSLVREVTTNAWDANVDNNSDKPVMLSINKDTQNKPYFYVRDYGAGMSPDVIREIYTKFGKSTKRGDNTTHGGFGIGKFAPLSYSENVFITTWNNGVEYQYLMTKSGSAITFDLLIETPSTEESGTKVKVFLKSAGDSHYFYEAVKEQLFFFDNLYLDYENKSNEQLFNERKIVNFTNFTHPVNQNLGLSHDQHALLMGKVLYKFSHRDLDFKHLQNTDILKMQIGDIDITPNREAVQFTRKTITKIQEVIDKSSIEKETYIKKHFDIEKPTLDQFFTAYNLEKTGQIVIDDYTTTSDSKMSITPSLYLGEGLQATYKAPKNRYDSYNVQTPINVKNTWFSNHAPNLNLHNYSFKVCKADTYNEKFDFTRPKGFFGGDYHRINFIQPFTDKQKRYLRSANSSYKFRTYIYLSNRNMAYMAIAWVASLKEILVTSRKDGSYKALRKLAYQYIKDAYNALGYKDIEKLADEWAEAQKTTRAAVTRATAAVNEFVATPLRESSGARLGYVREKQVTIQLADNKKYRFFVTEEEIAQDRKVVDGPYEAFIVTKKAMALIRKSNNPYLLTWSNISEHKFDEKTQKGVMYNWLNKYNAFKEIQYWLNELQHLKVKRDNQLQRIIVHIREIDSLRYGNSYKYDYGLLDVSFKNKYKYMFTAVKKLSMIRMMMRVRGNFTGPDGEKFNELIRQEYKKLLNKNGKL